MSLIKKKNIKWILLSFIVVYLGISFYMMSTDINISKRQACSSHLHKLAIGLKKQIEAEEPITNLWCDVLKNKYRISRKDLFICPSVKNGGYAINRNILGLKKIPEDVVVLFDSKSGWNLLGGPELLAPENHKNKGCNILFGNMEVKFVKTEDFGNLKWKP